MKFYIALAFLAGVTIIGLTFSPSRPTPQPVLGSVEDIIAELTAEGATINRPVKVERDGKIFSDNLVLTPQDWINTTPEQRVALGEARYQNWRTFVQNQSAHELTDEELQRQADDLKAEYDRLIELIND